MNLCASIPSEFLTPVCSQHFHFCSLRHHSCSYSHGCLAPFLTVSPEENFSSAPPKKKKKMGPAHSQAKCRQCKKDPSPLPFLPPLRLHRPASLTATPPLSFPAPPLPFALTIEATLQSAPRPLLSNRKEEKEGGKRKPGTSCQSKL